MIEVKKYNLIWEVDKVKKETLLTNVNFSLALDVKKTNTKQKAYTMGKLKIVPNM